MPAVRDLLDRFRPAGAPGAASAAGIPVDRRATAAGELEPVFTALAAVLDEGAELRREAAASGARLEAETAERARALVARARAQAETERSTEATRAREKAAEEAQEVLARANDEADRIRRSADESRPRLLAELLDRVRTELASMGGGRP